MNLKLTKIVSVVALFTIALKVNAQCNPPAKLNFSNIFSNTADVSWSPVSGAQGYEYTFGKNKIPGTYNYTLFTTNTLQPLDSNTVYYVMAHSDCGTNGKSADIIDSFTTPFPCATPTNIQLTPLQNPTTVLATWDSVYNANSYEYAVNINAPANWTPAGGTVIYSRHTATLKNVNPTDKITFCIRSVCSNSISPWSCNSVTPSSVDQVNSESTLRTYPNPVTDKLTIEFPSFSKGHLQLFNTVGAEIFEGQINEKATIDMSRYPAGLYFIICYSGEHTIVRKITKQ